MAAGDSVRAAASKLRRSRWYVKLAVVVVVLLGVAVAAVVTTKIVSDDSGDSGDIPKQSEPDPNTRLEIARRFAPVLRLDAQELFVPIDRAAYVADTILDERTGKLGSLLDDRPTTMTLPDAEGDCKLVANPRCFYFLDVRGLEPPRSKPAAYAALQQQAIANGATDRVYFHVTRYDDTGDYAVQYWFLYFLNYRLNTHESDWEQITLHLDPDQQPLEAFYSSHASGQKRAWAAIQKVGEHPVVFVALGSHANYFTKGSHTVTLDCTVVLHRRFCAGNVTVRDEADGAGRDLQVTRDYTLDELTGPVFIGSYGSGNYVVGARHDEILADPRTRIAWLNPLVRFVLAKRAAS
jgi:hypothetical protein